MARQNQKKFELVLICAIAAVTAGLTSELRAADPHGLNRAGQWGEVVRHFNQARPVRSTDYFILARAHDNLARGSGAAGRDAASLDLAFRYYLSAAGVQCRSTAGQDDIRACLEQSLKPSSRRGLVERLALLLAAELPEKFNYSALPQRLLLGVDLTDNDPLSRGIYQTRLKHILEQAPADVSQKLAESYPALSGPLVHLYRARAFAKSGQNDRARENILKAAESTATDWIQKAVYAEIQKNHKDLLDPGALAGRSRNNRRLLAVSRFMGFKELGALQDAFPAAFVAETATDATVLLDGIYLMRSGQSAALPGLAARHRNFLTMEPDILYAWATMLRGRKEFGPLEALFNGFPAARRDHAGFWREYVNYLESRNRDRFFAELVDFLNYYGADFFQNDRLIEFLIGKDTLHIQWAEERYWNLAYSKLRPHTWNGRFLYWLKRFHSEHNRPELARKITDSFYARAPGSYYAAAFWPEGDSGNYIQDWQKVLNRPTYLWWISKHGGNLKAAHFIARKNLTTYLDPEAVRFWNEMRAARYRIPGSILDLHYLGESDLGKEFYDDTFARKLPRREHLARRAYIGQKTGNLYIQVYFTRELVRAHLIPEDPFSMPAGLLATLYPRPYLPSVRRYATEYGIPEAMVYALMRQESLFRENAISRSGARGLMQVMPATGAWLFDKMKLPSRNLLEPAVSIQLGTKYMSDMLRAHDQDFRWASIAYNGGPGNLRKWKKQYYQDDFNLFLEKLPVAEPRNYCRITYQNYMHYRITYLLYP